MAYSYRTRRLGLPVKGPGEISSHAEDMRAVTIIENQLMGMAAAIGEGVLTEGVYELVPSENSLVVNLRSQSGPALRAIIQGVFVNRVRTITWTMERGKFLYLYVVEGENLAEDPSDLSVEVLVDKSHDPHYLLLATVDDAYGSPVLNRGPDGKVFSPGYK